MTARKSIEFFLLVLLVKFYTPSLSAMTCDETVRKAELYRTLTKQILSKDRARGDEGPYLNIFEIIDKYSVTTADNTMAAIVKVSISGPSEIIQILPKIEELADQYKVGFNSHVVGISEKNDLLEIAIAGYQWQTENFLKSIEAQNWPSHYELLDLGGARTPNTQAIVIGEDLVNFKDTSAAGFVAGLEVIKESARQGRSTVVGQLGLHEALGGASLFVVAIPNQPFVENLLSPSLKIIREPNLQPHWKDIYVDVAQGKHSYRVDTNEGESFLLVNSVEFTNIVNQVKESPTVSETYQSGAPKSFVRGIYECIFCDVLLKIERGGAQPNRIQELVLLEHELESKRRSQKSVIPKKVIEKAITASKTDVGARGALRESFPYQMYTRKPQFLLLLNELFTRMKVSEADQAQLFELIDVWGFKENVDIAMWGTTWRKGARKNVTKDMMLKIVQLIASVHKVQYPDSVQGITPQNIHHYSVMRRLLDEVGFPPIHDRMKRIYRHLIADANEFNAPEPPKVKLVPAKKNRPAEIKSEREQREIDKDLNDLVEVFSEIGGSGQYIAKMMSQYKEGRKGVDRVIAMILGKMGAHLISNTKGSEKATVRQQLRELKKEIDELELSSDSVEVLMYSRDQVEILKLVDALDLIYEQWQELSGKENHPDDVLLNLHKESDLQELMERFAG